MNFDDFEDEVSYLREKIKQISWDGKSSDWYIEGSILNPDYYCSNGNPLYKSEEWLRRIYYDDDLRLSMRKICKICKIGMLKLKTYFDRFGIERKKNEIILKNDYWVKYMPKDYQHPELESKYIIRSIHILVMEEYINKHPNKGIGTRGITKDNIIQGKYNDNNYFFIKIGYEVHHINFVKRDSRLVNLWLFSKGEHSGIRSNLNKCLEILIKLDQISFAQEKYFFNNTIDCRNLNSMQKEDKLHPIIIFPFRDIKNIEQAIKSIDWSTVNENWNNLNPYHDCSKYNCLYNHKGWMKRVFSDERFNLSDKLLGAICGVNPNTIYLKRKKFGISANYGGFKRIKSGGYILKELPSSSKHPYAISPKRSNKKYIYEHRTVMEEYLAKLSTRIPITPRERRDLRIAKDYLEEGIYLKTNCIVHHINLDKYDNQIDNLWCYTEEQDHKNLHATLFLIVEDLLRLDFIRFSVGGYTIDHWF